MPLQFDQASLPPAFARGDPGVYELIFAVKDVRTDEPFPKQFANLSAWTNAVQRQGVAANVLRVDYLGASNYRDAANWAQGLLDTITGKRQVTQVYDVGWKVTVQVLPPANAQRGVGAPPVLAGVIILVAIASVLGAIEAFTGKPLLLMGIRQVAKGAGDIVREPAGELVQQIALLVVVGLVAVLVLKKAGAKVRTEKFSF